MTNKIFIPCQSIKDWERLHPKKHWKKGYSARTLAYSWQEATGFPASIKKVFNKSKFKVFKDIELLLAIPEYKVHLKGGIRPSQNDVFVIAKSNNGLISITVEGKVNESFGEYVNIWDDGTKGKNERLNFLCSELGLTVSNVLNIRYQLIHRTVSAIIEAKKFNATNALMLIHAFKNKNFNPSQFKDYKEFAKLFKINAQLNQIHKAGKLKNDISLYLAWIDGNPKYLNC